MAMNSDYDRIYKLLLVGDSGTGKSAILLKFADDVFSESYISTIGVDFKIRSIVVDDLKIKLQIWDTAGQERFKNITSAYYKGSTGIFIVFDVSNRESFQNVSTWRSEVEKYGSEKSKLTLLGCKSDLGSSRQVTFDEASKKAKELGIKYVEVSAKTGTNIEEAFYSLVSDIAHGVDMEINKPPKKLNEEKHLYKETLLKEGEPKKLHADDVMENLKAKCCGK